jgi:hypothetical protein
VHIPWWGFLLIGIVVIVTIVGVKFVTAISQVVLAHAGEINELKGRADDLESRIDDLESQIEAKPTKTSRRITRLLPVNHGAEMSLLETMQMLSRLVYRLCLRRFFLGSKLGNSTAKGWSSSAFLRLSLPREPVCLLRLLT